MTPTPTGTRLILASENLLESWGTRTDSGARITADWGEPYPEGWYEPVFTATDDGWLDGIRAEAATAERERLIAEGWREPHRHSFTSLRVDDLHPEARCAGESCGVLYGELHPEPAK